MYLAYYLQTNIICITILMILLLRSVGHRNRIISNKTWCAMAIFTCVYCVTDMVAAIFRGSSQPYARPVLWVSNAAYIGMPLIITLLWVKYIDSLLDGRLLSGRVRKFVLLMPSVLAICLLATNPWTEIAFSLAGNVYSRKLLAYLIPALCWGYLLFAEAVLIKNIKYLENEFGRNKLLSLLLFIAPPVVVSVIQFCIYGLTLSQVGFTVSILLIFLERQNDRITTDGLTGINNREEFDRYLAVRSAKAESVTVFIIDIDNFKSINDLYGHAEGDSALILVAGAIRRVCREAYPRNELFYARYGGDEFAVIGIDTHTDMPEVLSSRISGAVSESARRVKKPYEIAVSIGYSTVSGGDGFDADRLVKSADNAMYDVKKSHR